MAEFFQNFSLQALDELDETTNIKFDAINELNKSINNLLMDEANKFCIKIIRLCFNSVNDFKSEHKKLMLQIIF